MQPIAEIDWRLVLEFVKALAVPIATISSVALVSVLGLRAFRKQKALEHSVAWYDRTCTALDRAALAHAVALSAEMSKAPQRKALFEKAAQASIDLGAHVAAVIIYAADQDGLQVVSELAAILGGIHERMEIAQCVNEADTNTLVHACQVTGYRLSKGIREQLLLPELKPPR